MHVSVPRQKCATCESFILFFYQRQLACQGPMFHTSLPPLISQLLQLLWSLLILSPSKPLLCLKAPLPSQNLMGWDANPSSFLHFLCTHSFHTGQFWEARGCTPANGERPTHLLISPPVSGWKLPPHISLQNNAVCWAVFSPSFPDTWIIMCLFLPQRAPVGVKRHLWGVGSLFLPWIQELDWGGQAFTESWSLLSYLADPFRALV